MMIMPLVWHHTFQKKNELLSLLEVWSLKKKKYKISIKRIEDFTGRRAGVDILVMIMILILSIMR